MKLLEALAPKKPLRAYMTQYAAEHTQRGTKLTHMVGIPMIVASLPAMMVSPPLGGALFVGGWALQLVGHAVYEKSKPSFLSDPFYLLVGPVWVAVEWAEMAGLPIPEALRPEEAASPPAPGAAVNGSAAHAPASATA